VTFKVCPDYLGSRGWPRVEPDALEAIGGLLVGFHSGAGSQASLY
jgi:hypothetical protein